MLIRVKLGFSLSRFIYFSLISLFFSEFNSINLQNVNFGGTGNLEIISCKQLTNC